MKPEAQRIAIAEACIGFNLEAEKKKWQTNDIDFLLHHDVPDYLNDLNAMHEAELMIECNFERSKYIRALKLVVLAAPANQEMINRFDGAAARDSMELIALFYATAAQRSEAFLRTIGKWQEQPQEQTA